MSTTLTNNTNQALYDTIDKMCKSVSFLDDLPTSKQSKLRRTMGSGFDFLQNIVKLSKPRRAKWQDNQE